MILLRSVPSGKQQLVGILISSGELILDSTAQDELKDQSEVIQAIIEVAVK